LRATVKKRKTSMRNVIVASAVLAALTGATMAWADDSGYAEPQSLKAQQSLHNGTFGTTTEDHGWRCGDRARGA
jgi:hypothetical protein